jgi:predicted lactoylglutathione lyase
MKLGTSSQIAIGTKDLEASTLVYDKLGFKRISEGTMPHPFIQYTDESTLIILSQDGMEYMGFIYFSKDMNKTAEELIKMGISFEQRTNDPAGNFFQGIFSTPDGVKINLVHYDAKDMYQPTKNLRYLTEEDIMDTSKYPNEKIGIFGEFSVPVKDLKASIAYWETIGFETLSINEQPYPWAIIADGLNVVGLHQTTEFNKQAITYFAPDMKRRIETLKEDGLHDNINAFSGTGDPINNGVLTTMENQKFFLFSF